MQRPLAILFDVDSTLITSGGAGASSWRWAFNELYGIPADIGKFTDAGMTDPVVCRLTFKSVLGRDPSEAEVDEVIAYYLKRLPTEIEESAGYKVLPGVPELLAKLTENDYLLGITSGAVEAAAHIKLSRADLNKYFSFGGYGSDSSDRGELTQRALDRAANILGVETLDPKRVLVVGDTPSDIEAAHAVDAIGVGVATGHFSKDDLKESGADYVLETLEEPLPGTVQ